LKQALTHRSFSADHNERLEFLGDSVLNLAVSDLLYERLASLPEGDLSRVRANLVKQETLHQLSVDLGLADQIRLGEGEMRSGGQKRPSILADALEAVIWTADLPPHKAWCCGCTRHLKSTRPWMPLAKIQKPNCRNGCKVAR
jgi:ribonuclease-3